MEQPAASTRMSAGTWGLLALLGMIWGGSFFFARVAVGHVPPATLVLLRVGIAALALHAYIAGRFGIYATLRGRWREFLLLGLLNNAVPHMLIFLGQTQIGAGLASILNAPSPSRAALARRPHGDGPDRHSRPVPAAYLPPPEAAWRGRTD